MPSNPMPSGKLSTWSSSGKSWFFGIGINTYKEFPTLLNAVHDVEKFAELLVEQYDVDAACTITLYNENATEENILNQLDTLTKEVTPNDKIIIYYSGHGMVNNKLNKGYWLPHDAKKGSSARNILNSTIQDYVGGIQAKHTLVISDSCFSGSMFMRGNYRATTFADDLEEHTSRWALCSGRHDEAVYDGDPGGHSPFAQSLLNKLSSTEKDFIPVGHLVNHVIEQTASNYEQLPDGRPMFGVGHEGGQYIFRKRNIDQMQSSVIDSHKGDDLQNTTATSSQKNTLSDEDGLKLVKWVAFIVLGAFIIVGGIIVTVMLMSDEDATNNTTTMEIDGRIYPTIEIGNQTWMATNMNSILNDTSLYLLDNVDPLTTNQLGQLYSYEDATKLCDNIPGGEWRLAAAKDFDDLATYYNYLPFESSPTSGYILPRELASGIAPGGTTGLSLQLGGKYYINSKEFSPSTWEKLNAGYYWLDGQRILNLNKYGAEYTLDITSRVPWNHACSCRCIKK